MKQWTLITMAFLTVILGGAALSGADFVSSASSADATGKCGYYVNSNGNQVPRPCGNWRSDSMPPPGATTRCQDGTWSWSQHPYARGTCSHHGGVASYR
jgi:hypothetical protein